MTHLISIKHKSLWNPWHSVPTILSNNCRVNKRSSNPSRLLFSSLLHTIASSSDFWKAWISSNTASPRYCSALFSSFILPILPKFPNRTCLHNSRSGCSDAFCSAFSYLPRQEYTDNNGMIHDWSWGNNFSYSLAASSQKIFGSLPLFFQPCLCKAQASLVLKSTLSGNSSSPLRIRAIHSVISSLLFISHWALSLYSWIILFLSLL